MGKVGHSKCSRRKNVFSAADLLVARLLGHAVEDMANESQTCPFLTSEGCSLIKQNLTIPAACATRIIRENSELEALDKKCAASNKFLGMMVRLVGGKKI